MRKNNSKVLKKNNKRSEKENRTNGSIRPKKAENGSPIRPEKSVSPSMFRKNTKKIDPFFDDPRYQEILKKALDQKNAEDFKGAAAALKRLIREFPDSAYATWLLGAVLYVELKKPRIAIPFFKKAIELNPHSERSSLGLFHCLWDTDQTYEALEEIKRYQLLTNWSCRDYLEIVEEIKEKWLDSPKAKKKAKTRK